MVAGSGSAVEQRITFSDCVAAFTPALHQIHQEAATPADTGGLSRARTPSEYFGAITDRAVGAT